MNTINNGVLNKNTLRVRYENSTPFFEIHVEPDLFSKFQTDHVLDIRVHSVEDDSLKFTIRLKSFRTTIHFHTTLSSWNKHQQPIRKFLIAFSSLETIQIKIFSTKEKGQVERIIPLPASVRETCKYFIGDFAYFEPNDGLEETFTELPNGFLVPYVQSQFVFLCKIEDSLFDKIKLAPYDEIKLHTTQNNHSISFSLSFHDIPLASFPLERKNVCEDIESDFLFLVEHPMIRYIITSSSMKDNMYLQFNHFISEDMTENIHTFFRPISLVEQETSL
ncbi:hypothetical protein CVD28_00175 [Bacillus sp. M6-12]|uniref:hypothetical protein n=1 Tax=Bacillus sp. M6-12 TaxID=2054166 RepID=UPI000C764C22|nr:hypothetical protein [Bacillus sp. M6-12]PLS18852.1 hypothetical protein CVD28_00175 [Bacillus sp. M6-12]